MLLWITQGWGLEAASLGWTDRQTTPIRLPLLSEKYHFLMKQNVFCHDLGSDRPLGLTRLCKIVEHWRIVVGDNDKM